MIRALVITAVVVAALTGLAVVVAWAMERNLESVYNSIGAI